MGTWYNYKCGSCGKHCHKKSVLRCNFCNIPLCWSCRNGGLCNDHYQKLTPQERMALNSAHLTFTWLFRIAFFVSFFAIIGAFGLLVDSETREPVSGILSGVVAVVSCTICFKSPSWEVNKMDKIRLQIRQRLRTSSGGITVENLFQAVQDFSRGAKVGNKPVQNFSIGLNVGTKPVQNVDLNKPSFGEAQISRGEFIICPKCSAKMPEGIKFCGVCGKPM